MLENVGALASIINLGLDILEATGLCRNATDKYRVIAQGRRAGYYIEQDDFAFKFEETNDGTDLFVLTVTRDTSIRFTRQSQHFIRDEKPIKSDQRGPTDRCKHFFDGDNLANTGREVFAPDPTCHYPLLSVIELDHEKRPYLRQSVLKYLVPKTEELKLTFHIQYPRRRLVAIFTCGGGELEKVETVKIQGTARTARGIQSNWIQSSRQNKITVDTLSESARLDFRVVFHNHSPHC